MSITGGITNAVLETRQVAIHFGGVKAVDGIDLALRPGSLAGILGPNGSGKTTLLAAITRLTPLTAGELFLDGTSYTRLPPHQLARRGVARTFQTVRLLATWTVYDNLALATGRQLSKMKGSRRERRAALDQAVERVGVGAVLNRYPHELSYGTQRRVEIARAIVTNPRVLLLDEPTAGMNEQERGEIRALLGALRDGGLAQLLIEHDVQMMVDICDYLYAMNFGRLIAAGIPQEVIRNAQVREAYLGRHAGGVDA
jgi:ABC-type branched-subunit amino acid transport system ATPase component